MHTFLHVLEIGGIIVGIAVVALIIGAAVFLSNPDNYR